MNQNVQFQVAALRGMSPAQLRDKYLEVFGEPTRIGEPGVPLQAPGLADSIPGRGHPVRAGAATGGGVGPRRRHPHDDAPDADDDARRDPPRGGGTGRRRWRAACRCPGRSSPASTGGG